ncbi:hypothetical protein CFR76_11880 [Komagataeibacter swingsii]|uniref:FAD dependent oxidoreductase domain-containing protein n=2 Tax=Komagataeibacter swingsii TaxID=215220 RepID=A0A2V4R2V6_9PROT|nr:hypothetical protein CFR76_11880 [Komagataeibacter swingsii]
MDIPTMVDAVVIGCGITGVASAYEMARSGLSVLVVDRFGPAAMASGWTLGGVRQSGRDPAELPLARMAVGIWETLSEELEAPTGYRQDGNLRLGMSETDMVDIRAMVADQKAHGLDLCVLEGGAAVQAIAPAISAEVAGASYCPTDGHADPVATVNAYIAAARRLNVTFAFGESVTEILSDNNRVSGVRTDRRTIAASHVIMATGIFGNDLLQPYGVRVPIESKVVTVVRSAPVAPLLKQVISVASALRTDAACAGRQQIDGSFRFTSGIEDWNGQMRTTPNPTVLPTAQALAGTIQSFAEVVPAINTIEIETFWCGLIDHTPDALPVMDRVDALPGLVVARGYSGHGFCLGPVSGRLICALVRGDEPACDLSAFRMNRFASHEDMAFERVTLNG